MEEKRLAGITGQYRENVEKEITALVKAQGIVCSQVSVQMEENKESSSYGKILAIEIEVSGEDFLNRKVSHKRGRTGRFWTGKYPGSRADAFIPYIRRTSGEYRPH